MHDARVSASAHCVLRRYVYDCTAKMPTKQEHDSPITTMKLDQRMQPVEAMSSIKIDRAVPVHTHTPSHVDPSQPTAHPLRPLAH